MQKKLISGIQQIGIGVKSVKDGWDWYREMFGSDVRVFEDNTVAELMLPYTGGEPQRRHAALAVNLQGGGGFEIWQYSGRTPLAPNFDIQLGDLGIYSAKIKVRDVHKAYEFYKSKNVTILGNIEKRPNGEETFYIRDPFGNVFQLVPSDKWFKNENKPTGATYGATIGVSDIDKALQVYKDILEYNEVIYDVEGNFADFSAIPGGDKEFRRILLKSSDKKGPFSKLFGPSEIELVQVKNREPKKMFENRFWGDLGFIHLCFDIIGMDELKEECDSKGFSFTVDSSVKHNENNSFDMGEAAGRFSYIEDPDGTLIEFVETHKLPVVKKLGWYMNIRGKNPEKSLPNWIINAMRFNKVKTL